MMITDKNLPLNYIKKEDLSGSYFGMRYLFQKEEDKMRVSIWPEPYCYQKTSDNKKKFQYFPLTEEGKQEAIQWLNQEYERNQELWHENPEF